MPCWDATWMLHRLWAGKAGCPHQPARPNAAAQPPPSSRRSGSGRQGGSGGIRRTADKKGSSRFPHLQSRPAPQRAERARHHRKARHRLDTGHAQTGGGPPSSHSSFVNPSGPPRLHGRPRRIRQDGGHPTRHARRRRLASVGMAAGSALPPNPGGPCRVSPEVVGTALFRLSQVDRHRCPAQGRRVRRRLEPVAPHSCPVCREGKSSAGIALSLPSRTQPTRVSAVFARQRIG